MFSVVIPLFNKQESIKATLSSVLAQSWTRFEVLIVNDGSTDNSRHVAASFVDARVRIIDKPNGGVSSARNRGIKEATYEHIAFIDGDDLWNRDFLKTIAALIQKYPTAEVFGTGYSCNSDADTIMFTLGAEKEGIIDNYFKLVYKGPVMHASSICITKKAFEKAGLFSEKITHGEDYNMWDRLGMNCEIALSPQAMASYRVDAENRAMNVVPPPEKLWIYHLEDRQLQGDAKKYYKRHARRYVWRYLTAGKPKWALKLAKKTSSFVSWYSYLMIHEYKDFGLLFRKLTGQKLK